MKVESKTLNVQSTMMGEKVKMGVQVDDMPHIMSVLTDLYKNRLRAIVREYPTNATDAHIEAGVALPIEITLPTALTPTFKVRDYGTGLDADGIREVYSQYGRSTKRDTNAQTGMLGLGSKSALTYADQFTVTSVKDGRRLAVLVSRDEDGAGHMQLLGNPEGEPTNDASGTEISVAIRREDITRCASEARDVLSYWPEGGVLINGEPPEHFAAEGLRVSDSLYIFERGGNDKVVMGNVAYPQPLDLGRQNRNFSVTALVPIGSVKPTPSREALMDTKLTKDTLAQVVLDFDVAIQGAIQREIDKASSPHEAVRIVIQWSRYVGGAAPASAYTYKGHTLPAFYEPTVPSVTVTKWGAESKGVMVNVYSPHGYGRKSAVDLLSELAVALWPTTVWVANFEPKNFAPQHKDKLLKWCRERQIIPPKIQRFALLRENAPDSIFIDPAMKVEWETIKAIKLDPPASRFVDGAPRIPGSFDVFTEDGYAHGVPGDSLRQNKPLMWVQGNRAANRHWHDGLATIFPAYTLVLLPENRVAKFVRTVPKAKPVREAVEAAYKKWSAGISAEDRIALAMREDCAKDSYSVLDPAKVKDPALRKAIRISKRGVEKLNKQRHSYSFMVSVGRLDSYDNPLANYPLYDIHKAKTHPDHVYLYLNAAFAAA